jgi:hypothetical protein
MVPWSASTYAKLQVTDKLPQFSSTLISYLASHFPYSLIRKAADGIRSTLFIT